MKLIVNASMDFFVFSISSKHSNNWEILFLSDTDSYNNNIDYEYSIT